MEFAVGGLAAMGAGFFTNPMEVIKTRMQLQGELRSRGLYTVHYRNFFHAMYTVAKVDGVTALQKGLVPALWYQLALNGVRLGAYQFAENQGWTLNKNGQTSAPKSIIIGALAGCAGSFTGSPLYLVKTHLQSQATGSIAVGHQHQHSGMGQALMGIYKQYGIQGLWRGVMGSMNRVLVGSAAQLSTFTITKEWLEEKHIFQPNSLMNTILGSMLCSIVAGILMTPFDVISTRLYNQGVDKSGRGLMYTGVYDCFTKTLQAEGMYGFYKGFTASYARLGPHFILTLLFWDILKDFQKKLSISETKSSTHSH
ncbi:solute carrier family 25 member 35-like [Hetaerina americana]|uniref:solute carrier family 25 member 35-like n=1 Tax=Hetaerina americana TaxID=62018 RepID=UPI003A7F3120